jgi:glucose-6-phosphate isomerase
MLLDITNAAVSLSDEQLRAAANANAKLNAGTGRGNDFLGWTGLPSQTLSSNLDTLLATAADLRDTCEVVVVIGIGGSYLGAKAVIEALSDPFANRTPHIVYAGHNIGADYLHSLSSYLKNKSFGIIYISKSGTTTEPAIAFRILRKQLEEAVGTEQARTRIVAITDPSRGALRTLADREAYRSFVIPNAVGGRFSIFAPVGLLPIAVAGIDIQELLRGATEMEQATNNENDENPAIRYAAARNELYKSGKKIEILANFHPQLHYVAEWWKQLFGESEGKEHKGIFPAAVDFTTDLHSMGQWIQDGERSIFETVLSIAKPRQHITVPFDEKDLDGLNYLAGQSIDHINKMAELGTQQAHLAGGVPNIRIELPELNAFHLGALLYFFERACGISGYLLGVNPFDQPGVEAYKKNMFRLLHKPGY